MPPERHIRQDIVEEHFETLISLWQRRNDVVFADDWTLDELAALEDRAEAHLDGLRLAGQDAISIARPCLSGDDPAAAAAATLVLVESTDPALAGEAVGALAGAPPPFANAVRGALRHCPIEPVLPELQRLALDGSDTVRCAALDVLAFHRVGPAPRGMASLLDVPDPLARTWLYGAVGRFGGPWNEDMLRFALNLPIPGVRLAAIHASARLGLPRLTMVLRKEAGRSIPEAIAFLGVVAEPADIEFFRSMLARPDLRELGLAAIGAAGNVNTIPDLLALAADAELAPLARAAFVRITGAANLSAAEDPQALVAWWADQGSRFAKTARWQWGVEITPAMSLDALDTLPLGIRHDVFLGLCASDPSWGQRLEPEARARLQRR